MPRKHSSKIYIENGYYHIYNRGVEKRDIFLDDQDYQVFLHLLKYYLSRINNKIPYPSFNIPSYKLVRPRPLNNLADKVDLLAFCLMPNHFHLIIKQLDKEGMKKLMLKLCTTYSMYFNKRNNRVGHLFQSIYKAVLIDNDSYLLHLSRYIHLNPIDTALTGVTPVNYPYSSYQYYLGIKKADWVKPQFILQYFKSSKMLPALNKYPSYRKFVEGNSQDPQDSIRSLIIETD
jgi:putative transposase